MRVTLALLLVVSACGGNVPNGKDFADAGVPDARSITNDALPPLDAEPDALVADAAPDAAGCVAADPTRLHVDGAAPAGGNGSTACPFRTITEALDASQLRTRAVAILLAPGTYDAERFPLDVGDGIDIEGDLSLATTRAAFIIDGSGDTQLPDGKFRVTVLLRGALGFVTVEDSSGSADYLLFSSVGQPLLGLVTLDGGNVAAYRISQQPSAAFGAQVTIENQCEITGSQGDGILVDPGLGGTAPTVTIGGALIHDNNNDGVHVRSSLAGSAKVTVGAAPSACVTSPPVSPCFIYCNGRYGVELEPGDGPTPVDAAVNQWDHDAPTSGAAPADVNDTSLVLDACPGNAAAGACNQ